MTRRNKNKVAATPAPRRSLAEEVGALLERGIAERQQLDSTVVSLEQRLEMTRVERDKTSSIVDGLDVLLHGAPTEQG